MNSDIDGLIAEYRQKIEMLENLKKSQDIDKQWGSLEEMMRDLKDLPKTPSPKKLTIEEIDEELDIIRGVKPTPSGYTIKPERMKDLMKQRKELVGAKVRS